MAECRWCRKSHRGDLLCRSAKKILDAMYARGMEGEMPTIEFPEPLPPDRLGLGLTEDDRLVSQLIVNAASVTIADAPHPALILSGRDPYGRALPRWFYVGGTDDMARLVTLVSDTAAMAIRAADSQRG